MTYESCINYERTEEEFKNQEAAWNRSDKAFFASGACHILAFVFVELAKNPNYKIIFIKPAPKFGSTGTHLYVADGKWAFDFNGWTKEENLLSVVEKDYSNIYPGWNYKKVVIDSDLQTFCLNNDHQLPKDFVHNPIKRAREYIRKFSLGPPTSF